MQDGWSIVEVGFDAARFKAYEGLFTLGSGYLHVRGSLEEHLSDAPQNISYTRLPANVTSEQFRETKSKWGTYVPGVFGKHPLLNNEMINLPWFLGMTPIVDGERLDVEVCAIEEHRRELRLDTAVLVRTLKWRTRMGKTIELKWERFVSAARPHWCVQRLKVVAAAPAELVLEAGVDADVRTNGYDHFTAVTAMANGDTVTCTADTDAGEEVAVVARVSGPEGVSWRSSTSARAATLAGAVKLEPGQPVVFEKRTFVWTSREGGPEEMEAELVAGREVAFVDLLAEHEAVWRERWAAGDVVIEGDPEAQLAVRTALFHLLRAHVPDARVAIDAKGYAGEAYWGRYFWDTEMYLLPFFLYTQPGKARTLVDFRVQSLPGAKANAKRYGYPGARYAWESDAGGYECCPNWQYADHEIHVTADVVYGLAHYAHATGDFEFLAGPAAEVIRETARYWLARVDQREGEEHVSLLGVMGPDEYTPISNNNSFTNRMAAFALDLAAQVGEALEWPEEEWKACARTAEMLPIVSDADNELVLQCEGFDKLAEPRFEELWKNRAKPFAGQVAQERLYRSKCLKQADVLMLMMLFPEQFSPEEVRRAWDYYLPYTTHDSSLSAGTHAIVATRLGLEEEAWRFWQMGKGIDLDVSHGGAAEGIHIANAGAVWQMVVFGFAGMRTAMQAEKLTFTPQLPAGWTRVAFPVVWKGRAVFVEMAPGRTRVANRGGEAIDVVVGGEMKTVAGGTVGEWSR